MCDCQPFSVANSEAAICCEHGHILYSGLFSTGKYFTNSILHKDCTPEVAMLGMRVWYIISQKFILQIIAISKFVYTPRK